MCAMCEGFQRSFDGSGTMAYGCPKVGRLPDQTAQRLSGAVTVEGEYCVRVVRSGGAINRAIRVWGLLGRLSLECG